MPSRNDERAPDLDSLEGEQAGAPKTTAKADNDLEPLVVPPRKAGKLLHKGHQKIYDLLRSGELESYVDADGRARNVTMASIKGYITRRLEAAKQGEGLTQPTAAANAARAAKRRHTPGGRS
jgi:hypothetical protein